MIGVPLTNARQPSWAGVRSDPCPKRVPTGDRLQPWSGAFVFAAEAKGRPRVENIVLESCAPDGAKFGRTITQEHDGVMIVTARPYSTKDATDFVAMPVDLPQFHENDARYLQMTMT
jgi:hypothetical protein